MNRNKLKTYAPKARRDFIAAVTARAAKFGITKNAVEPVQVQGNVAVIAGQAHPKKVAEQRAKLEARIKTRGFEQVMEEAAYTWFNRFAAIRYMEVHGYLDHGYRVFSHPEGKATPEIVEHAQHLDLPGLDREKVIELKLDGTKEGELYRMLLLAQCNALHTAMPFLFERIDDETELLLPDNLLHSDSVIRQMVTEIDEENWQEIEIIGWLYQFYISEKKDQVIGKQLKREDIPAATQLFTPNWIVKYMVHNTLGAKWLATYPKSFIRQRMEYYVEPTEQTDDVSAKFAEITPKELNPEEITFLDPACGSGHILVEAYDLFKEIYLERGYVVRDIPRLILEKNLFGLDIDERAAQLAAFALLMKARADDKRLFNGKLSINVCCVRGFAFDALGRDQPFDLIPTDDLLPETISQPTLSIQKPLKRVPVDASIFNEADILGSLITVTSSDVRCFEEAYEKLCHMDDVFSIQYLSPLQSLLRQSRILAKKYDCVAANPPYLGARGMPAYLKEFGGRNFACGQIDVYASFVEKAVLYSKPDGYVSLVTMHSWLFMNMFSALREFILDRTTILSAIHLGPRAFPEISGEIVQTAAFALRSNNAPDYKPTFVRLVEGDADKKCLHFSDATKRYCMFSQREYADSNEKAFSYWVSRRAMSLLNGEHTLQNIADIKTGMITCDNSRFLREWYELDYSAIEFSAKTRADSKVCGKKWFPYNKGGGHRKWYGNFCTVVNWHNDGEDIISLAREQYGSPSRKVCNTEFFFRSGITWSVVSGGNFGVRIVPGGFLFDTTGNMIFPKDQGQIEYIVGILNTSIAHQFIRIISPTQHANTTYVARIPILNCPEELKDQICKNVADAIRLAKQDWDCREVSWDFKTHDCFCSTTKYMAEAIDNASSLQNERTSLIADIEAANDIAAAKIYDLPLPVVDHDGEEGELNAAGYGAKSIFSFSLGCMMGRYSLDEPGLIYANSGGVGFDPSRYTTFPADDDGIVPIMQTDWFDDDAANRFVEFVKVAWSPETLAENLKFVADSLGAKAGETPIDTIRRYLSTDFFKDHLKTYKKRPIYWLFSSGKEKAFEALVYLHRYNEGTLSRMRMEYVTPLQGRISARIDQLDRDISAAGTTAQQNKLRKEQEKLKKQQAELIKFDEQLRHYADMRIKLDLDDGVKVNYGKFGTLLAEVKAITGGSDE